MMYVNFGDIIVIISNINIVYMLYVVYSAYKREVGREMGVVYCPIVVQ